MRRRFFLFAAPAIIAAPSLMRVSAAVLDSLPKAGNMAWYSGYDTVGLEPIGTETYSLSQLITETLHRRGHLLAEKVTKSNAIYAALVSKELAV